MLTSAGTRRGEYFGALIRSRAAFWWFVAALVASVFAGGAMHDLLVTVGGPALAALLIAIVAYRAASRRAETEFFAELAPALGLTYTIAGDYIPITPLLGAGDRRRFENTMQGPLFGRTGGPPCLIGHFTYETRSSSGDVEHWAPHPFTVCAIDLGDPILRFHGIYLRRRLSALGLDHDWLKRAPRPEEVELESERFGQIYELRRAADQDTLALRELFSPSLVVWLSEHPLHPAPNIVLIGELRTGTRLRTAGGQAD